MEHSQDAALAWWNLYNDPLIGPGKTVHVDLPDEVAPETKKAALEKAKSELPASWHQPKIGWVEP